MPPAYVKPYVKRHKNDATDAEAIRPHMAHRDRSILVAERRFRGITDMAGAAAGRTQTRMTQSGHAWLKSSAMQ